ncbi:hypothetical protein SMMN14_08658 [Sphaerulina musiva]
MLDLLRKPVFDPEKEIPSLSGKVILITGGTGGLGRETVVSFASHDPAHIYFTGRSQPSADETIRLAKEKSPNTPVEFVKCDLASFASIKVAAKDLLAKMNRLDILMANAGIMAHPPGLTEDGYELQFGTNHVGHALLVKLLTPLLLQTAAPAAAAAEEQTEKKDVRIIWDSSLAHRGHPACGIDFSKLKTDMADIVPRPLQSAAGPWIRYAQSKLANMIYARAFAHHYPQITSVSLHPGVSATGLIGGLSMGQKAFMYATSWPIMIPAYMCAWNQQWAATAPLGSGERQVESGTFYMPVGKKGETSAKGRDKGLEQKLWEWTEEELKGQTLEEE